MTKQTKPSRMGGQVRVKKEAVVTHRGKDPVVEAVARRAAATDAQVNSGEWQADNRRAQTVFNQLNRLANGMVGITPERVVKALRLDKETTPRAYAKAYEAAQQVADAGDRTAAQAIAARVATDVQDVIDADTHREPTRYEILNAVLGRNRTR